MPLSRSPSPHVSFRIPNALPLLAMAQGENDPAFASCDDSRSGVVAQAVPTPARIDTLMQRIAELERENEAIRAKLETFRQTENQLKRVLEGADEGFWDWDLEAQTFTVSERFETMFGLEPGERDYSPERWADYVHPDDLVKATDSIRLHLEGITPNHSVELRCKTKSGEWIDILTRGRIVSRDASGKPLMMSGTHTDITERKRAEARLIAAMTLAETASRDKSRFLAAASHDLRQPVQAMRLLVDALWKSELNKDQQRLCRFIDESTQAICSLLEALLDISKLDSGVIPVTKEEIQVHSLVSRIDREFSALAVKKSLRFKLYFPFSDMAIVSDSGLLMSLLGNLIGNALKYTEKGGVLVAFRRRRDSALIQVWDSGTGIAPDHLESIFQEYFQVGNPERDRSKGLGLGLAIAKRIASLLNTEVRCRSRLGKGSVFEFLLPLAAARETPTQRMASFDCVSPAVGPCCRRVALIEDDVMVGEAIKSALESCGMSVTRYRTAEDALADIEILAADFFITDLMLPGMNGIELLDALQGRTGGRIKAVVLTGDSAINRIEILRSTSRPVLFKPVDLSSLLAAMEAQACS